MRIDDELVRRIASLARLRLDDDEIAAFGSELTAILDYVERLAEADVSGVPPWTHPLASPQPLREDEVVPSLPADRAIAPAAEAAHGHIRVPKVLPR